jgi:hypothetical protein
MMLRFLWSTVQMSLETEQLTVVHDEVAGTSDPVSPLLAEYNAILGNGSLDRVGKASALADKLNATNTNQTVIRASMSGSEVWKATDLTEFNALPDARRADWLRFCGIDVHDPEVGGVSETFVVDTFGAGSNTTSMLATRRQQTVSRAAKLELPELNANDMLEALPDLLPA